MNIMAGQAILIIAAVTAVLATLIVNSQPVYACAGEPILGSVCFFAGNFAPRGFAFCDGQLLSIAQNTALFSLLGTTYGGNGQTNFALPDMRGRQIIHPGNGPGLSNIQLGQMDGAETVTLNINQIPSHNHGVSIPATDALGNDNTPSPNKILAKTWPRLYSDQSSSTSLSAFLSGNTGGSQPHSIRDPYIAMNCLIAMEGIFPSRN